MDQAKRKQTIMLVIVAIIFLAIGYLVYANFLSKKTPPILLETGADPSAALLAPAPGSEAPLPPLIQDSSSGLNTDILNDPRFSELKIFGDVPIEIGPVGRENPFVPYEGYTNTTL
ncbi:MAG: hypothetical protein Q8N68_01810 [bacterium]|nr:hypothetical protein [bacterium]